MTKMMIPFSVFILVILFVVMVIPAQQLLVHPSKKNTIDYQNDSPSFAELSFYPHFHNFSDQYQGIIAHTTFEIWNSGCCGLTYNIIEECEWVKVSPTYGHSYGVKDVITVTINTTTLSLGMHTCEILLDTNDRDGIFKVKVNIISPPNHSPDEPVLIGPSSGHHEMDQTFTAHAIDPDGDSLYYLWDWGDGTMSEWIGPVDNNTDCVQKYCWNEKSSFQVRVQVKDEHGAISDWSDPHSIEISKHKDYASLLTQLFTWILLYFR